MPINTYCIICVVKYDSGGVHGHEEAMAVWEEACKAAQAAKNHFMLKKPMPGAIKKGTKWPTRPKHVEVASEGKQNDKDGDGNNCSIRGAMGRQTPKGILSGPSAM